MSFIDGEPRDHEAVHIALARHAVLACQDLFKMVRHAMLACQEACFAPDRRTNSHEIIPLVMRYYQLL